VALGRAAQSAAPEGAWGADLHPDGSAIYFSRDTTPGGTFQYAQNSNQQLFAIERYDLKTGERTTVAGGPGGAVRPQPSPDGRYLAYVKRERASPSST
jgi:Tol biopolymer transport system component